MTKYSRILLINAGPSIMHMYAFVQDVLLISVAYLVRGQASGYFTLGEAAIKYDLR